MKNIKLFATVFSLLLVFTASSNAQTESQSAEEGFVGLSAMRQNVETLRFDSGTFRVNQDTDSIGFNAAYTHYLGGNKTENKAGVFGITGEIDAQFHNKENSKVALISSAFGVTLKARNNKYIQPYGRALAGFGRRDFGGARVVSGGSGISLGGFETTGVYIFGTGVDFNTKAYSRYKIRVGLDYVNTGWGEGRQHNGRFTTGLVF